MRVILAGYNVDAQLLGTKNETPSACLTPEVLSAAYARISRDPRPIGELRRIAADEIEKARASNRKIIFEMGHHSVAEHAVFNFDIIGISRLAIEWLERFRLCSYTEKSQRYITLDHDFVIPEEFKNTPFEQNLLALVTAQASCYTKLFTSLRERFAVQYPQYEAKKSGRRLLDGRAKEDARYVTLLATTGQLGLTANARNLELIIRRSAASPLAEVRELGRLLYEQTAMVAPSLLLFTHATRFDAETESDLKNLVCSFGQAPTENSRPSDSVKLISYTPDADRRVAAALIYLVTKDSFARCLERSATLSDANLRTLFETALGKMEFYDAPPREFEHVMFSFEISLSSSAYAQLKRHRMTTQTVQGYEPALGITIPPSIVDAGLETEFLSHLERAETFYHAILDELPDAAPYALTNAHRRRVLLTMNLRELYHFTRLRDDHHAQWDIRGLAGQIRAQAARVMPLGTLLLSGKDEFPKLFESVFGHPPTILPPRE